MSAVAYIPERGDIIWLSFDPVAGHEQSGHRPAFVVSPGAYNEKVGLALVCPITSRVKGYPFEVGLPEGSAVAGVVLADHARSVDWRARSAELTGRASRAVTREVIGKLSALLE